MRSLCTLAALGVFLVAGCFGPEIPAVACGPSGACPGGRVCDTTTNLCAAPEDIGLVSASCGDNTLDDGEACDEGGNNTASCNADCTLSRCGDGKLNPAADEQCDDGNAIEDDGCNSSCRPTSNPFADLPQLYCNSLCGNWDNLSGCQQGDADAFCKLKLQNASAKATSYETGLALAAPGVCCPPPEVEPGTLGCVVQPDQSAVGVSLTVSIHPTDLVSSHGPNGTVVFNVVCSL